MFKKGDKLIIVEHSRLEFQNTCFSALLNEGFYVIAESDESPSSVVLVAYRNRFDKPIMLAGQFERQFLSKYFELMIGWKGKKHKHPLTSQFLSDGDLLELEIEAQKTT